MIKIDQILGLQFGFAAKGLISKKLGKHLCYIRQYIKQVNFSLLDESKLSRGNHTGFNFEF